MYIIGMIMIIFRTKYIEKIIIAFTVKIQQVIVIPDRWWSSGGVERAGPSLGQNVLSLVSQITLMNQI